MKRLLPAFFALTACASAPTRPPPEKTLPVIASAGAVRPPVSTHRLDNGLEVHLLPDKSAPLVSVQIWVKVGSVDEHEGKGGNPGITGLSHFFEHLMFQGTERFPNYDVALAPLGAKNNAFTFQDATVYWAYTPREHLRTILDIEADRFAHIKVDFIHLEPEREVVKSERRQRVDADPAELAEERATRNTFDVFPYRWGPIGWMSDLDSIPLDAAQRYHAQHYRPDNAYLVITGDFDPEETLAWVREFWGPLSASAVTPSFARRSEIQLKPEAWSGPRTDHVVLPASQTTVVWSYRAPAPSGPTVRDYAALELIDWALTGGKSGRLSKRLVFAETPRLSNLSARLTPLRFPFAYVWRADLLPGVTVDDIERALDEELLAIATDGLPQQELAQAVASLRADLVRQNLSHSDKGESIGFALSSTGSPFAFHERLALYGELAPEEISAAARTWLSAARRSRVTVVPPERLGSLIAMAFEGHPQQTLAGTATAVFATGLDLADKGAELDRERKAIALLAQRADLAMKSASTEEKAKIKTYLAESEMGTAKRTARVNEQIAAHKTQVREHTKARRAAHNDLKKAGLDPSSIHHRMLALLIADLAGPIEVSVPMGPSPDLGLQLALLNTTAFALEARGLEKSAQDLRQMVLDRAGEVTALTPGSLLASDALDLARDTSRSQLPLVDRPLSLVVPTGGPR